MTLWWVVICGSFYAVIGLGVFGLNMTLEAITIRLAVFRSLVWPIWALTGWPKE